MLKVLDLFSGIGGFSLGLERTGGFQTVAFCEIDPFCRRVLAKHWPNVRQYEDVRELTAERLPADGIGVDVICGGFPCQDISHAGKGAGLAGERSGLWSEIARLAGELRPRFLIVENVSALLGRGLDRVLGDLAEIGFDAEWHCIPAAAVGAPHIRDRVWIVAHPQHPDPNNPRSHREEMHEHGGAEFRDQQVSVSGPLGRDVADADRSWRTEWGQQQPQGGQGAGGVADAPRQLFDGDWNSGARWRPQSSDGGWWSTEPDVGRVVARFSPRMDGGGLGSHWAEEPPDTPRVAHGVKDRVARLRALGNAVVPQIPELIGRAILEAQHGGG